MASQEARYNATNNPNPNQSIHDILNTMAGRQQTFPYQQQSGHFAENVNAFAQPWMSQMQAFGTPSYQQGMANLYQILAGQGQTDPRRMNMMKTNTMRGTESAQEQVNSAMAQRGMGNSAAGQAINASVGQAGQQRLTQIESDEAQRIEDRKRQDLALLLQLVINPNMDMSELLLAAEGAKRDRDIKRTDQKIDIFGKVLSGVGGIGAGG